MKIKNILIILLLLGISQAQTIYEVPIGSKNNQFEFELENLSSQELKNIIVLAEEIPDWIKINQESESLLNINETSKVGFSFDVEKETEIGTKGKVEFIVIYNEKTIAEKTVEIEASLPKEYSLSQNYPNPFNPTTVIEFQLPVEDKVLLKIYNMLGQEVCTLLDKKIQPGVHQVNFNASSLASGRYIYKLITDKKVITKKMMLLK